MRIRFLSRRKLSYHGYIYLIVINIICQLCVVNFHHPYNWDNGRLARCDEPSPPF